MARLARFGLQSDADVVAARREVTEWAREIGLSDLDRAKVVTAASELARNTIVYGRGGVMSLEIVRDGIREGLRLTFEDHGPGIADIDRALEDGFSTGGGMGLGLPGARRLVNEFDLTSTPGEGTCITIVQWKP
ncbi:MAG: anti-sigma regulatory factor [Gemmatimonadota bacterium]|nr:anti-sigma regulatory factor [Gemmatimonadota bacterium]